MTKCPFCNKNIEFVDTGVGWKCPSCSGQVFSEYIDQEGVRHRYTDPTLEQKKLFDQSHVFDLDPGDMMMGVTEPGPFFSPTFASKLLLLADILDKKGCFKEANVIDRIIKKKKIDPITQNLKDQSYIKLEYFPKDHIYSLSGEPLSNL